MTGTRNGTTSPMLQAALHCADHGIRVFPCKSHGEDVKQPHTQHGFHDATTNGDQILAWWKCWPDAFIGMPAEGMLVVDVDRMDDGTENPWLSHTAEWTCPTVRTRSGGFHFYFSRPSGAEWKISDNKLAPKVDIRTTGGYTIVPPSPGYTWVRPMGEDPLPDPPYWLAKMMDDLYRPKPVQHIERAPYTGPMTDDRETALAALNVIEPGALSYQQWTEVLMALHSVGPDMAGEADRWSARDIERYQPGECQKKFAGFNGSGGITLATLCKMADDASGRKDWRPERRNGQHVDTTAIEKQAPVSWPQLVKFDDTTVPEFPVGVLPDVLRNWIRAESIATQTPADLAALLALATVATCIARRVTVEPRLGWIEPTNLYVAALMEPGSRKSAVFADATRPLREIEAEQIDRARPYVARWQSERRQAEARLAKLEKLAVEKGDNQAREDAAELAEQLALENEPVLPRLLVDDVTVEKLAMLLADHGGKIASMSAEGGVFDAMAAQQSKSGAPAMGVYLMGHSGDDLLVDRVSRKSIRIPRPALTCAYAMQPNVIQGLSDKPAFRGRGLLARFLYAVPVSTVGSRNIAPPSVPEDVQQAYRDAIRGLADESHEHVLRLMPKASDALLAWEAEVEAMLADGGDLEALRDWGGKLVGATLRIAAGLHCISFGTAGFIEAASIEASIEIGRYLIPHAQAAMALMGAQSRTVSDAQYVADWITRHRLQTFSKRDAYQNAKHRFPTAEAIDPALTELADRGFIRVQPAGRGPGRPSLTYDVNPAVTGF